MDDLTDRYKWIRDITDDALAKRSMIAEFHGLHHELRELQKILLETYERTKPIKHPRDKGDQREEILRHFLVSHGLIPEKYAVSSLSTRAVSSDGRISPELDILIYDKSESIVLKRFSGTLEYFPIESVHGTIQVKSKLTKTALREGLENIKSFKSLTPGRSERGLGGFSVSTPLQRRFGILFAYEYELEWGEICRELGSFLAENPAEFFPNGIFILDKGYFVAGSDKKYCLEQKDLKGLESPIVYGFPDHTGNCLSLFYLRLMDILKSSVAGVPDHWSYEQLPLVSGSHSYAFSAGSVAELWPCSKHGTYLKRINEENIDKIVQYARSAERINWIRAMDIAAGKPQNEEMYENQQEFVRIYNPNNLPFSDILIDEGGGMMVEMIDVEGMRVWLPWHYLKTEMLIEPCPKCFADITKRIKRSARTKSENRNNKSVN
ncbi:MAG TPA: DUF6602 domain-containing protein [Shinella sp.]|uniref:DUF6602 domain-containing protein n=1 Tax=Shinella sp. TaxID=1870904 RepID=UPI002E139D7A|nr:DUF6602 domain-containing protein [Shinella sp.]